MSLNDIKISPFLVKKMYEKTLVESSFATDEKNAISQEIVSQNNISKEIDAEDSIQYLGKNNRHILVVVNEKDHKFLGDDELSFLMNILSACYVTMADVASSGWRRTSRTLRGNSGSSSRKSRPLWARETSPGRGIMPPPMRPASEMVWWGERKGR